MSPPNSTSAAKSSADSPSGDAKAGSWLPDRTTCIVAAICITIAIVLQMLGDQFDFALINILTLIALFIPFVSLMVWLTIRSSYAPSIRFGALGAVLGLIILAVAVLQVESVDGNMIPKFRFRWQASADSQLGQLNETAADGAPALPTEEKSIFTQFLGPNRNGYLSGPELATDWTASPPLEIWRIKLGAGWSGFVVDSGLAVTMEQRGPDEWVTCYRFDNGAPVWGHSIKARHETVLGGVGPRSTPTIVGGRVYALGATGVLRCLELTTGNLVWQVDLLERQGVTPDLDMNEVAWGRANSPLVIGDMVVVPEGGPRDSATSLLALNINSGDVVWESGTEQISYCSPSLENISGVDQIVIVNEASVSGHEIETGKQLWNFPWPGSSSANASNSQPHVIDGDKLFISKGYGEGSSLMQIAKSETGEWSVTPIWKNSRVLKTKFTNAVLIDGFAYGLSDGILECVDLVDGHSCWKKARYGHGQVLGVGKNLLVQTEVGTVKLVAANPEKFEELGSLDALTDKSWNNLCLVGDKLIARSSSEAVCYRLATEATADGPAQEPTDESEPTEAPAAP